MMTLLLSDPVMLITGLVTHYILILMEMSGARKEFVSPWALFAEKPYKTILSFIGSIVAYAFLIDQNPEPSPIMVFVAGYMANDALDRATQIMHKTTHVQVYTRETRNPNEEEPTHD